jgi:hypothetical protein
VRRQRSVLPSAGLTTLLQEKNKLEAQLPFSPLLYLVFNLQPPSPVVHCVRLEQAKTKHVWNAVWLLKIKTTTTSGRRVIASLRSQRRNPSIASSAPSTCA